MIGKNEFIEWCEVHANFYGTAKIQITSIQDSKRIPLLDIDVQGALKFQKVFPDSNFVFISPPSVASLKERLLKRGTETEETLNKRLANASGELVEGWSRRKVFNYRIVNSDLAISKMTFETLVEALYHSEFNGKDEEEVKQEDEPSKVDPDVEQ